MGKIFSFCMFYVSLIPLWVGIIIKDCFNIYKGNGSFALQKWSILVIVVLLILAGIYILVEINGKSSGIKTVKILEAKEDKNISTEYLITNILPLFTFDFYDIESMSLFAALIVFLSFLFIKHRNYSLNIFLELIGYSSFECEYVDLTTSLNNRAKRTIIIKGRYLKNNARLKIRALNNNINIEVKTE